MGLNGGSSSQIIYVGPNRDRQEFVDVVGKGYGNSYTVSVGPTLDQAINASIEDPALELSVEKDISIDKALDACRIDFTKQVDLIVLHREIVSIGNTTTRRGGWKRSRIVDEDKPDTLDELTRLGLGRKPAIVLVNNNGQPDKELAKVNGLKLIDISRGPLKSHIAQILAYARI